MATPSETANRQSGAGPTPGTVSSAVLYPHVLTPLQLRGVTLKNRIFFPAMGIDLGHPDGTFSPELDEFYGRIARSGCGLVVLCNSTVSPQSILQLHGLRLFEPAQASALADFIAGCGPDDAVIAVQLQHYGGQATTRHTGAPVLTPSGVGSAPSIKRDPAYQAKTMTREDIATVIDQFAYSTRLAVGAGARFVQLQASNGYLLNSFLSPYTNKRDDEYGGTPQRRARFVAEVVRAVRSELGPDRALGLRVGINDCVGSEGLSAKDFRDIAPILEDAGADLFEASISIAETFDVLFQRTDERQAFLEDEVGAFKAFATIPVGFAGFVGSLAAAEKHIASGLCDTVGMARALFADNDLIIKTLSGRIDQVDLCLWDGKCFKDKSNPAFGRVYCCVNPLYKRPVLD